jgi:hypothetical protein
MGSVLNEELGLATFKGQGGEDCLGTHSVSDMLKCMLQILSFNYRACKIKLWVQSLGYVNRFRTHVHWDLGFGYCSGHKRMALFLRVATGQSSVQAVVPPNVIVSR